jgi:hypothetical protein
MIPIRIYLRKHEPQNGDSDTHAYQFQPRNAFLIASRDSTPKDWAPGTTLSRGGNSVTDPTAGTPADRSLQFDRAERAGQTPGLACSLCQQPIAASYYEINGKVTCLACRGQIMAAATTDHERPRALVLLFGVAVLLALAYAAPVIIGFSSPLHLLIAGFALYEAWKLTRGVALRVTGPYQASRVAAG